MVSAANRVVKFPEKLVQPISFGDAIGHGAIHIFIIGPGHCRLVLGRPGNEIVHKEDIIR
jgi:hypothetical protein